MTKVKLAIYRDRKLIGLLGVNLTRTTKEITAYDVDDDVIKSLKRLLEGGRK